MGRPPVVEERTNQILDAVVACILRYGLAHTTRSKIALEAGVKPSAVHHFIGTQERVIEVAIDRALGQIVTMTIESLSSLPPVERLPAQLDILFGEELSAPEINQLLDELVTDSYHTPTTRTALAQLYLSFAALLDDAIADRYPGTDDQDRAVVTHGLLAMAHSTPTFAWLGFEPRHRAFVRRAADVLLATLEP